MPMCEKCWADAHLRMYGGGDKAQADHYRDLLKERQENPCTEAQQRGEQPTRPCLAAWRR